ncbi:MAG: hypothetical protein IJ366_05675 [Clostridia bacterium]|nr:hypothetical protein [Clostridia bacterium]
MSDEIASATLQTSQKAIEVALELIKMLAPLAKNLLSEVYHKSVDGINDVGIKVSNLRSMGTVSAKNLVVEAQKANSPISTTSNFLARDAEQIAAKAKQYKIPIAIIGEGEKRTIEFLDRDKAIVEQITNEVMQERLKEMPQSVKCFSVSENNISTLKAEFEKNGIEYQFVGGKDGKISCIYPAEYAEQVAVIKEDYKRTFDEVSEHFSVIADVPETERQAEITARIDELTNAEIGSEQRSEVYSTILSDMQSRDVELPEYSENNMRIISGEMPNATQMAGKAFWEQQGYELNEGAKGVEIVAPQMDENGNPVLDENGNQTFTNVTVYDISETNAYETAIRDELNSLHNEYAVERAAALAKADITEITVADDLSGESVTLTADKLTKEQVSAALQENLGYSAEKADIAANKVCYDLNLDRKAYFAKPTQIDNINALRTNIRYQSDDITIRDTRFDAVNFKDGEDTHIILRHGDSSIGLTPAKMSRDEMKKMCVSQLGMSEYQADKAVSKAVKIESQIRSKLEERTVNKQGISQEMHIERT